MTGDDGTSGDVARLDRAAKVVSRGELVVYPTETVYGLGGNAVDPAAIDRVFAAKDRPRDRPLSLAVPTVAAAGTYTRPTDTERSFMQAFLPGPVTVVLERQSVVPDVLTGGRDRVGVRVPDHDLALALLERVAPLTATSANRSGQPSVRRVADLDTAMEAAASVVFDGGETAGVESTVVDVQSSTIIRRGAAADAVEAWLDEHA